MAKREFLSIKEAADAADDTQRHIRRLVQEKKLRHYKLGGKVRIARADLDAFIESCVVEARAS